MYEGYADGSGLGVSLAVQQRIRGLDASFNTLGAFEVAVGQPYLEFSAAYGKETLTLASFSATKLDGSLFASTISDDFTTTGAAIGRAAQATLGNTGAAPTTTPVTSTGATGSISSTIDVNTLSGGAPQNYTTALSATLQRA
jgi:hypothetical protein